MSGISTVASGSSGGSSAWTKATVTALVGAVLAVAGAPFLGSNSEEGLCWSAMVEVWWDSTSAGLYKEVHVGPLAAVEPPYEPDYAPYDVTHPRFDTINVFLPQNSGSTGGYVWTGIDSVTHVGNDVPFPRYTLRVRTPTGSAVRDIPLGNWTCHPTSTIFTTPHDTATYYWGPS